MQKLNWQIARVTKIVRETRRAKTFTLQLPQWQPHLAGQHYDIRLTAADGFQAQRSYSIASPPSQAGEIELTVDLIPEGQVSTYLHEGLAVGDPLEVRGPIGGYFVWGPDLVALPLLLVAGGSGIVPLMAMLRHRRDVLGTNPTAALISTRTLEEAIYREELEHLAQQKSNPIDLRFTLTRQAPLGWAGYQRRIDRAMLIEVLSYFERPPQCFVCGPSQMVEYVANTLAELGVPLNALRTERFGP
jgi:ferredoxin-NADP reductase